MHAAHHYSHYNYAAHTAAQQYSHLMGTAGRFPMNPAMCGGGIDTPIFLKDAFSTKLT